MKKKNIIFNLFHCAKANQVPLFTFGNRFLTDINKKIVDILNVLLIIMQSSQMYNINFTAWNFEVDRRLRAQSLQLVSTMPLHYNFSKQTQATTWRNKRAGSRK